MDLQKNGVTWSSPQYDKLSSRFGSKDDLIELKSLVDDVYLITEYMKASSKSSGYNVYFDASKKINDQLYLFNSPTDTKYLLEHSKVTQMIEKSFSSLSRYAHSGLAIQSMGHLLYEDYANDSNLITQIELMKNTLNAYDRKNCTI